MKHKMEELSIEITYRCPMNCIHCSSRAELGNETKIPTIKIIEMIDKCKKYCGTTDVSLSGGEPFEHPDFWEIMKYIKGEGLNSIVYSCGIESVKWKNQFGKNEIYYKPFSIQRLNKLKEYCDKLIISLHGTPKTHNKIMNIQQNAFLLSISTIKSAIDMGINVEIHFVPTKFNYKDIKIIYGFCLGLGVSKMSVLRYVPQGRGLETSEKEGEINLTKEEFKKLQEDMLQLKKLSEHTNTQFRIGIPADFTFLIEYLQGNKKVSKEKACTGGKTKILVKADGLVQVCPAWKELNHLSAGNIYKDDIVDIWVRGDTYVKFREFQYTDLPEPCKSCIFVKSCLGGCGAQRILSTTSDINGLKTAPDPLCFYEDKELWKKEV